jgi:putative IMPACT (imprinted ancient) family translation regulator
LVRAYSQTAVAGVEAAGVATAVLAVDLTITLDYSLVGKVQYLLAQQGALTLDSQFGQDVTITCRVLAAAADVLENELAEASSGHICTGRLAEVQVDTDLQPIHRQPASKAGY